MAFIDPKANEINCKIVYAGPAMVGKTTSMQYIYDSTPSQYKDKFTSVAGETDRYLFFNFIDPKWKKIHGYQMRLHVYTVPGAVFYNTNRLIVLRGVEAIIYIADSQIERADANYENFYSLEQNLKLLGYRLKDLPYVLQVNKRDLARGVTVKEIIEEIFYFNEPVVESVAYKGIGVFEAFNLLVEQIVDKLSSQPLEEFYNKHQRRAKELVEEERKDRLINLLQTETDESLRFSIINLLAEFDDINLFDLLVPYLDDANHHVRRAVIHALKKLNQTRATNLLSKYLATASEITKDDIKTIMGI